MPIEENRVDTGGLTALAANRLGNMGLPVQGVLAGEGQVAQAQGIAKAADLKEKYAEQGIQLQGIGMQVGGTMAAAKYKAMADMNMAQFNQQNENLRTALQTQSQQAIAQSRDAVLQNRNDLIGQRNNQQAQTQQAQLGINQQNADTNTQRTQQQADQQQAQLQNEQMKTAILARTQMFNENKQQAQQRAGAAAYTVQTAEQMRQQGIPQPQIEKYINDQLDFAHNKGMLSDDEAKSMEGLPLDQKLLALHHEVSLNYMANTPEAQKMLASNGAPGLTPQTISKLQTDKTNIDQAQTGLSILSTNNSPDFYNVGAGKSAIGAVEGFTGIGGKDADLDAKRTAFFNTQVPAARDQLVTAFGSKVSTRTAGLFNDMLPTKSDPNQAVADSKIQAMKQSLQLASQIKDQELAGKKIDQSAIDSQIKSIHDSTVVVGTYKGQPITQTDLDHNIQKSGKDQVMNSPDIKLY